MDAASGQRAGGVAVRALGAHLRDEVVHLLGRLGSGGLEGLGSGEDALDGALRQRPDGGTGIGKEATGRRLPAPNPSSTPPHPLNRLSTRAMSGLLRCRRLLIRTARPSPATPRAFTPPSGGIPWPRPMWHSTSGGHTMTSIALAPSILSAEVEAADADRIHVDVMDGHFVPKHHDRAGGRPLAQAGDPAPARGAPDDRRARSLPRGVRRRWADGLTVHVEGADPPSPDARDDREAREAGGARAES